MWVFGVCILIFFPRHSFNMLPSSLLSALPAPLPLSHLPCPRVAERRYCVPEKRTIVDLPRHQAQDSPAPSKERIQVERRETRSCTPERQRRGQAKVRISRDKGTAPEEIPRVLSWLKGDTPGLWSVAQKRGHTHSHIHTHTHTLTHTPGLDVDEFLPCIFQLDIHPCVRVA